jgi:hypothetical protein
MNGTEIIVPLDIERHAQDLRRTWQARVLAETRDKTRAVIRAMLTHSYAEAMPILLRVVFPNLRGEWLPRYIGAARILRSGVVVCDIQNHERKRVQNVIVFDNQEALIWTMRTVADKLRFTDSERIEFIEAAKRWIVADERIDHLGRRLAS